MPHRSDLEAAHARIGALERELAELRGSSLRPPPPPLRVPPGFELRDDPHRLRISWNAPDRPWPAATRLVVAACLALVVFIGVRQDQLVALCITGIAAGLGVLLWLGGRVAVEVAGDRLHVPSSQVTDRDDRLLWREEIQGLHCVQRRGPPRASYELWCDLVSGARLCLVRSIETAEGAEFLERALEGRLGIGTGR